ncbi:MAG: SdpI family protein [Ruminococcus sp.]|nr:SdpI family protein [Ruminococcus sp.]
MDSIVDYRTRLSTASTEAWKLANKTCSKLWITGGIITTVLSVILPFTACLILNETAGLYAVVFLLIFQITAFILSVVTVENKLKLQEKNK